MNTAWIMERRVVHNRRTWIRELWVGCGIVSVTAELGDRKKTMKRADDCTSPEFPLLCTKSNVCVFASWAQRVHVMRTFWRLTVFCRIYTTKRNPDGNFPYMLLKANTAGPDLHLGTGPLLLLTTTYTEKKEEERVLLPGRKRKEWRTLTLWLIFGSDFFCFTFAFWTSLPCWFCFHPPYIS